jgi:hypothetical protein
VTTTRRGWQLELDAPLVLFTLVVCGAFLLLATMPGCDTRRETSSAQRFTAPGSPLDRIEYGGSSPRWLAVGTAEDPFDDDDDDNDDGTGTVPAGTIVLTVDEGHFRTVIPPQVDVPSSHRSEGHSLRGPPSPAHRTCSFERNIDGRPATAPAWRAGISSNDSCDDDDDDDDDGLGTLPGAAPIVTDGDAHSQPPNPTEVDRPLHLWSEGHSLRGPPSHTQHLSSIDRDTPAHAFDAPIMRRSRAGIGDSSDDSGEADDNDSDNDAGSVPAASTTLTADPGHPRPLIQPAVATRFFFASDGQSLRAPPRVPATPCHFRCARLDSSGTHLLIDRSAVIVRQRPWKELEELE